MTLMDRKLEAQRAREFLERQERFWRALFILLIVLCLIGMFATSAAAAEAEIKSCVAVKTMEPNLPAGVKQVWGRVAKFWPDGSKLRVRFLTGTKRQKEEAWKRFQSVDALVNLSFEQVTTGASDVRVRFDRGQGHWSVLGTDSRSIPSNAQTMNLDLMAGILGDKRAEWDRVVIHEVLHAIGLEHEHQSPAAAALVWNKPAVYAYYARTQGWSAQQVDFQVINRSRATAIIGSAWDAKSIMEYPIPPGLANVVVGWNDKLTSGDLAVLQRIYPLTN